MVGIVTKVTTDNSFVTCINLSYVHHNSHLFETLRLFIHFETDCNWLKIKPFMYITTVK